MRWLAWIGISGVVACTRMNPSYGESGGTGDGADDDPAGSSDASITEASASRGEDAEASAEEASSVDTGQEDSAGETGMARPCCAHHLERGCEEPTIEACVCEGLPECCEIEWSDDCVNKARTFCNAECGALDDGPLDTTDTTDTMIGEETAASDSSGSSTTATATMTSDEGGSTGPDASACCTAQDVAGCNDLEVENCVCEEQGLSQCCSDAWEAQCVEAVSNCSVVCG